MSYNITVTMNQLTVTDATESTPLVTIRKPTSGGSDVTVDTALNTSSNNAIANAPVATAINTVNASLTEQAGDISALETQVGALASGTPTVVSTVAGMSDTTKIYLYSGSETGYTSGDWYYWNGSAWTDGGTYGTGTISNNARNLLTYILRKAIFSEDVTSYIDGLDTALKANGTPETVSDHTIYYLLTNVTSDVETTQVTDGDSFTCTLTADADYRLVTVTVTMGGSDVTSTAYSAGVVTIASVTGDVVITATATVIEEPWYTLPQATTFTGNTSETIRAYVYPLDSDADYTITWSFTGTGSYTANSYLFSCMKPSGNYWGLMFQAKSGGTYVLNGYGAAQSIPSSVISPAVAESYKIAIRHTQGESNCYVQIYKEGTETTYTIGSSLEELTEIYIVIGGSKFKGTLNDFTWYKYRMTDAEVTAYFEA